MTGNTVTLNRRFKRKDGALLDLEIIARTIPDNKVLAFGRDITERKKNESIIKKEKELSDSIINSLPGIFYIFNQTPKLVRWNKRFEDVSGYSKEELKKLSPLTIFHKDDREEMRQTIEKTYNTGIGETEVRVVTKNGHIIPFILTGTALMYEGMPCIIGTGIDISQRRATEIALAESENFLRTIIDTEPECVKLLGKNGELENMNGAGLEMIEADNLQQVKGHSVINIICEPFRKDFEKLTKNVFKGIPGKLEFEIEGLKGTRRWLETHATPLKNSNGEIVSLLGVTRDITLRKQAEDIILKERDLSDSIINNLPDIFYLFNEKGNFLRWNNNFEKISGYNAEEIKSITPFTLFEDKDKDALHYKLKEVLEKGKSEFDGDLITKKNTRVPYYFKGWKIKYEGKSCIIGIGVDMTIRKEVEEELRKSEEKYKMLFEDNPMPLWMRSLKNHRFIDVNKAAINHYGYSKDEFLEMAMDDIRTKTDSGKPIKTVTPGKEEIVNAGIKNHIKKDGSEIKVDVFGHNTMYGDEEVRLVLAIDVTEKLKAEELLKRSYEDIRRLASHLEQVREEERIGIAREIHDELGQQLTVLKLDLSWLDKRVMDTADEKSREKMNDMLALIDTTVKTVRRISSELRPTILDDLGLITAMEWQVKEFEKRAGIKIIFKTNVGEIDLPVNKSTSLYRIFQESLTNIARHSKASKVNASIIKGKGHIIMTIHDNGQGFDPLIIGNKKTLGILGMKERVNILGGEYFIQSEPGKGTEIRIEVPMSIQA